MSYWPANPSQNLMPIKHLATFNPEALPEDTNPDFQFDYIDIGSVTLEDGIQQRETLRFEMAPSRARKPVRTGDVIVSTVRTYLKAVARVGAENSGSVVSTGFAVLRPKANVDEGYLYRMCQSNPFVGQVEAQSAGVSYPAINPSTLSRVKVPLPHLDTQKAIASFLDREAARIDRLIAMKERQAAVLSEREEATFLDIVTAQDSQAAKQSSGVEWIGDIPLHWSVPKFTHVARLETGHTPSRKEEAYWVREECVIPWFSLADVWQVREGGLIYVTETAEKISQIGMENSAARLLPAQTVVLSRTASVGFPAILSVPMATTQDFVGWICGARVRPKFLYYVLRSMKPAFRRLMMGSTHQTIYMPDIRSLRLPLPPLTEQDAIVARLDRSTSTFRAAAAKITASVAKLREYRAALITAAVTRQIEVPQPDCGKFRLVVGAEIIHQHQNNLKFGRVKLQKQFYLAEAHLGIDEIAGAYLREAAGPLDRGLIDQTERALEAARFYRANQPDGAGTAVTYVPLDNAGQHRPELNAMLGSRADGLRNLISLLRDLSTEAVEAVATLYAVWNDALIDRENPNEARIIHGVLSEWHSEKREKFRKADLERWLDWMKRQSLTPSGKGPRTVSTMTRDMFS